MVLHNDAIFQNRKHAAYLLGERLTEHSNTDAIIVAVPSGGIHIGAYLGDLLNLELEVIPCKKIRHPADPNKTIGAVSTDAVVIREDSNDIPQDYVYHQIQLLQHVIKGQCKNYSKQNVLPSLKDRTVILVDDLLKTGDTMLAVLRSIRKQEPKKIVVAVPNVTPEATRAIASEIDEIIYLTIEPNAAANLYADFPDIDEAEVLKILRENRK